MKFIIAFLVCVLVVSNESAPAKNNGKYKRRPNEGKYLATNEGKYVHKKYPYRHLPDRRELGIYKHIHIPYDGGYGPYSGFLIPYLHDGEGDYSLYSLNKYDENHPFNNQVFDIPVPQVALEYGFPEITSNFRSESFAKPQVPLEYGFPEITSNFRSESFAKADSTDKKLELVPSHSNDPSKLSLTPPLPLAASSKDKN